MRTNTKYLPEAITWASWIMAQKIRILSQHYREIEVYGVCGNHGRMDPKPTYKEKVKRNWDYAVYILASLFCKELSNVKFFIPQSPVITVPIIGKWAELLDHGDCIKSRGGTSPYYGIIREYASSLVERIDREDLRFQIMSFGHWHHEAFLEERIQICPSLKGPDQHRQRNVHFQG